MLSIRRDQEKLLDRVVLDGFAEFSREHLLRFFPETCAHLAREGVIDAIAHGQYWAHFHGFQSMRDCLKYLNLMFVFGRNFDTDPSLPWVGPLLHQEGRPQARMDRLYGEALNRCGDAMGYEPIPDEFEQ